MTARTGRTRLLVTAGMAIVVQSVLAAAASVACAAAASATASPSSAPAHQPTVNWLWLGFGLGGSIILLVGMFLLTRVFGKRSPQGK
jgi:hypothetical protein